MSRMGNFIITTRVAHSFSHSHGREKFAALFEKGSIFLTESWSMGGKGNDLFNLTPPTSPLGNRQPNHHHSMERCWAFWFKAAPVGRSPLYMVVNSSPGHCPPKDALRNSGLSEFIGQFAQIFLWSGDVSFMFLFWVHLRGFKKESSVSKLFTLGDPFFGGGVWSHYTPENQRMSSKKGAFL